MLRMMPTTEEHREAENIRLLRLALCGALAGVAVVGTAGLLFGFQPTGIYDVVAGSIGFVGVVAAVATHQLGRS
jgi:hypothetical protein